MWTATSDDQPRPRQPEAPADDDEEHDMTFDSTGYLKAELDYRAARISATTRGGRRRHVRVPLVRRPADTTR